MSATVQREGEMANGTEDEPVNERTVGSPLIKTCGEFWDPELVRWGSPWKLWGKLKANGPDINLWPERGVYILYKNYVPVYVGRAERQCIGDRLYEHRFDWKKGARWDSFSWFGIGGLLPNNEVAKHAPSYQLSSGALLSGLEALLIAVIDPRLNSRREWLKGVLWFFQSDTDRPKPVDMEARLNSIESKVDQIIRRQGSA